MSEEVLSCLLGRIPSMLPRVVLKNHSRHPVRDRVYPGVIPSTLTSSAVEGVLLFDLSPLEMKLLDYFEEESIDYKRTMCKFKYLMLPPWRPRHTYGAKIYQR